MVGANHLLHMQWQQPNRQESIPLHLGKQDNFLACSGRLELQYTRQVTRYGVDTWTI
jgi:hypothetical protein